MKGDRRFDHDLQRRHAIVGVMADGTRKQGARRPRALKPVPPPPVKDVRAPRVAFCLWCGEKFTCPEVGKGERLLYCSKTHTTKYQRVRRLNRDRVCPRPDKRKYPNQPMAARRLAELQAVGRAYRWANVYKCGCGWWHIGRPSSVRRALQRVTEGVASPTVSNIRDTKELPNA